MNNDHNADECKRFAGEREVFEAYLKDCDEYDLVPSVTGAFRWAWQARAAQPAPVVPELSKSAMDLRRLAEACAKHFQLIPQGIAPETIMELFRAIDALAAAPAQGQQVECQECERLRALAGDRIEWLCTPCRTVHTQQRSGILQPCPDCGSAMSPSSRNLREIAQLRAELAALKAQQVGRKSIDRSAIREVFLRNGFTIKEGHDDLKPYVYAAAEELLALYTTPQPAPAQDVAIPERKETGEWESARIADFNSGWNACIDEVVALLEKAAWMELDTTNRSISIQDEIRSALAAHDKQSGGAE